MIQATWDILLSLAPWLLLGMAIAGLLHVLLPGDFVRRHLAAGGGVVKAVTLGVPLPLCSCGVIPVGLGLQRDGASRGATVGFLVSTPQTGVDAVLVSAAFLGWPFALFKVAAAAVTGIAGGLLADAVGGREPRAPETAASEALAGRRGWREGLDHALMILRSIWHWIVVGVLASAAITAFVPDSFFVGLSAYGPVLPLLGALLISLPLYVCSTASVPIAAALVAGGMPVGAALVFLMAGPATNVATVGAVFRALGGRALAVYLATIIAGSLAAGWLFDFVLTPATGGAAHVHGDSAWWTIASALLLLVLLAWFALADLQRWMRRAGPAADEPQRDFSVSGMHCGGCVSRVENALLAEPGVRAVAVDLEAGRATVRGSVDPERVAAVIEKLGFDAEPA